MTIRIISIKKIKYSDIHLSKIEKCGYILLAFLGLALLFLSGVKRIKQNHVGCCDMADANEKLAYYYGFVSYNSGMTSWPG